MANASAISTSAESTWLQDAPLYLTAAAAVTTEISIAAFQILMGLALVAILSTRGKLRWAPVATPLAAWIAWTLVSFVASGHFRQGLPQIKKFYVYLMLFLVISVIRTINELRSIVLGWAAAATLSSAWSLEQFVRKY